MKGLCWSAAALGLLSLPAAAQDSGWREYAYPEQGFLIQFPATPTVGRATWPAAGGKTVPATTYRLHEPGDDLTVTVADFTDSPDDRNDTVAAAVDAARARGEAKLNIEAHVDFQFGRQLSIADEDGGYEDVLVFFLDRRLYVVSGRALPPNAEDRSDRVVRFAETLSFPNHEPEPVQP